MQTLKELNIKIFADGADIASMKQAYREGIVKGFTTNPTLMRKAGVTDYEAFGKAVLAEITELPVSFEVLSDDFPTMEREARKIASWGTNVYVKIPITNTKGDSSIPLIRKLTADGLALNITAILTREQIRAVAEVLSHSSKTFISVFAGRIADTGRDPIPYIREAVALSKAYPHTEVIWASPRELLNIFHAEECGCHIITVTTDILNKLFLIGKNLDEFSLDTVKMFYRDAQSAGLELL